ncbi:DUF4262 domain-containing protein [Flammeovirga pectinis]|uniref:DUF4262 domain-containing protein n=1 Tax=Flammeovirga pectinis TaxID=2494373 RepID=A0A3Q9FT40_9BACT|nr:DUF4262 domain-containing protein [Flammeovirga pectinis]AZQ64016.1 DUF4262 domain-containing protein [Flammeovirga pectinis]
MEIDNFIDIETEQLITKNIKEHGYHLGVIDGDEYLPSFAFTIGLYKTYNHPEIIIFGLSKEVMQVALNTICQNIQKKTTYTTATDYSDILNKYPVQFVEVAKDNYFNYLDYCSYFYDNTPNFPALQLVWTDKQGHFPWDKQFDEEWKFNQPLLDRNTDFKFYEEKELEVYTTKYTLQGNPILWVYHTHDGDWEFHSEEHPDIDNVQTITLGDLVQKDKSLNDVHILSYGQSAVRKDIDSPWEFADYEEED